MGFRRTIYSLPLMLTFFTAAITPLNAQTLDIDGLRASAEAGDIDAQRDLGEAMVFGRGGADQDKETGVQLLTQAAQAGNVSAQAILGKLLLEGYVITADPDRGEQLLIQAAEAGDTSAQTTLGYALLWGINRDADPDRARALLERAAEAGDPLGVRLLGQQLLGGWVFDQDVERGLDLLEQAAAGGDSKALVSIGKYFLYRSNTAADRQQAIVYFEDAAALGNGEGLASVGSSLMWSETNAARAEDFLRRAGELGYSPAWTTLATGAMYGYLGPNSRSKFDGYAELGRNAGEHRIAVLEAQRQMWGITLRANGPKTLEGLIEAAENGNPDAAMYVVRLVRDGNRLNIRKDVVQARALLDRFSHLMSPVEFAQTSLSIDIASTRVLSNFPALAERFLAHPELSSVEFGEDIYKANQNFAFYLLQSQMRARGTYNGALNGLATQSTLRSVYRECLTLENPERCNDTVMRKDIIGALLAR